MSAGPQQASLLLDLDTWDLVVDAAGNIALATAPYSTTQSVANACRTFLGECFYDRTQGVPYLQQILGKTPPLGLLQAAIVSAAESVPGVQSAVCVISNFDRKTRTVSGQVQWTGIDGTPGSLTL